MVRTQPHLQLPEKIWRKPCENSLRTKLEITCRTCNFWVVPWTILRSIFTKILYTDNCIGTSYRRKSTFQFWETTYSAFPWQPQRNSATPLRKIKQISNSNTTPQILPLRCLERNSIQVFSLTVLLLAFCLWDKISMSSRFRVKENRFLRFKFKFLEN